MPPTPHQLTSYLDEVEVGRVLMFQPNLSSGHDNHNFTAIIVDEKIIDALAIKMQELCETIRASGNVLKASEISVGTFVIILFVTY